MNEYESLLRESESNRGAQAPVSSAGLRWSVKLSFLNYVAGLPDGQAGMGGGVTAVDDRVIIFPTEPTPTTGVVKPSQLRFAGEVRFGGHHGLLFVRLADPWLELSGDSGEMTVADPFLDDADARVRLVTFTVPPAAPSGTWTAENVKLADGGVKIFNEIYPLGEPFEAFSVS